MWLPKATATVQRRLSSCFTWILGLQWPFAHIKILFSWQYFYSLTVFANQHVMWCTSIIQNFLSLLFQWQLLYFLQLPWKPLWHAEMLGGWWECLWSDLEVIPRISDPERMFSPDKRSSFFPKNLCQHRMWVKECPIPLYSTSNNTVWSLRPFDIASDGKQRHWVGLKSFIPSYKYAIFMKMFPFFQWH